VPKTVDGVQTMALARFLVVQTKRDDPARDKRMDEQKRTKPTKRALKGALDGACFGAVAGPASVLVLAITASVHPIYFPLAAVARGFIGTIGGFASRLPQRGLPLVTSIGIVAAFALVARIATIHVMGFQKFGYPDWPALVGGAVVLCLGVARGRWASRSTKPSIDRPQGPPPADQPAVDD
jgi:hypothetical protein